VTIGGRQITIKNRIIMDGAQELLIIGAGASKGARNGAPTGDQLTWTGHLTVDFRPVRHHPIAAGIRN
jgi:hypothetical protein